MAQEFSLTGSSLARGTAAVGRTSGDTLGSEDRLKRAIVLAVSGMSALLFLGGEAASPPKRPGFVDVSYRSRISHAGDSSQVRSSRYR